MKLVVKDIVKETDNAVSIYFKNGGFFKKLAYKSGQFLTIEIPIDDVVHKRAYSFSSSPTTDKDLQITVKRVEGGLVSNYVNDQVKIGDKIAIEKPTGSFYVEPAKERSKQYVFFAGGSGITPIFSIIKSILVKEPKSKILLIYANQNYESVIFMNKLAQLQQEYASSLSLHHILDANDRVEENFYSGLVGEELLSQIFEKENLVFSNESVYMICGPFGYMEVVKDILRVKGVKSTQIKEEVFSAPTVKLEGKDLISDVEIRLNNETHNIKVPGNETILKVAMRNNIVLPYACRAGVCVSCKANCIEGEVKMTEGHFLEDKDVNAGKVLTCISYPVSENVVIAY